VAGCRRALMLAIMASGRNSALRLLRAFRKHPWIWASVAAVTIAGGILVATARRPPPPPAAPPRMFPSARTLLGPTHAEAAARRPDVDFAAIAEAEQWAFLSQAIRANLFTLFNLDLFVIAILMFLLGSPWSTFLTLLVLTINVCLNVLQEVVTKRRLDALL